MRHAVANPQPSFLVGVSRKEHSSCGVANIRASAGGLALRLRLRRFGRVYELEPNQRDPLIPRAKEARLRLGKLREWLEKVDCRLNIPRH
jgi:hypothetical protein